MFGATFLVALSYMIHARLEGEVRHDSLARILVMLLAFTQPLVRGLGAVLYVAAFQAHAGVGHHGPARTRDEFSRAVSP